MKFSDMPYTRVELADIEKNYKELIGRMKAAKSGEEQFEVHQDYYTFFDGVRTNMEIAMIRHDIDTTDEFYEKEQDHYDEITPILNNYDTEYKKLLFESPYREYLESKIGKVTFKNIELSIKSFDEKLIPLM